MSNATNGEFTLTADGKEYRFKVGTAALIRAQEQIGKETGTVPTVQEFLDGVANMRRMLFVRTFLWAGLRKYHADMGPDAVEDLMDSIDVEEARKLILGLAQSTQPDARDLSTVEAAAPLENPPTPAQATTTRPPGRVRSISRRVASG